MHNGCKPLHTKKEHLVVVQVGKLSHVTEAAASIDSYKIVGEASDQGPCASLDVSVTLRYEVLG